MTLAQRFLDDLQSGMTVASAAAKEGVSLQLGQALVADLTSLGLLTSGDTFCATEGGACRPEPSGAAPELEVPFFCSGCPLAGRRTSRSVRS